MDVREKTAMRCEHADLSRYMCRRSSMKNGNHMALVSKGAFYQLTMSSLVPPAHHRNRDLSQRKSTVGNVKVLIIIIISKIKRMQLIECVSGSRDLSISPLVLINTVMFTVPIVNHICSTC